ncbi:hypothetical protein DYS74_07485 [Sinirhodobacter hankyongi]|uniref:Porin n=2 Tax=Paenirhodobacter hankyongi TaxID=2294033 RepID=A0A421BS07_9RHOB|nr:hypothetical protein DYS74_07485 [Sinirhodobacter hankyongi]
MMQKKLLLALCAAGLLPQTGMAEVTGAEVGFHYSTFADADANDMNKATLGGALEYAFAPQFTAQADLSQRYYGLTNWDGTTFTLHGSYRPTGEMAAGAFVGHDWLDNQDVVYYGLEFANKVNNISYEAAFTHFDSMGKNANGITLRGGYEVNQQLGLGGRFDVVHGQGNDNYRISGTADYQISPGLMATGELGFYDGDGMPAESFVGVGVKATFGNNNGVTFGGRGLQDFLPGL